MKRAWILMIISFAYSISGFAQTQPCAHQNPTVSVTPATQSANQGQDLVYHVSVKNNDASNCGSSSFSVRPALPDSRWLTVPDPCFRVTLAPGESQGRDIVIRSSPDACPGAYTIKETATNDDFPAFAGFTDITYVVTLLIPDCGRLAPTVSVNPSVRSAIPGQLIDYNISITNNDKPGCGMSAFDIKPVLPPGWVSVPNGSTIMAAPGETVTARTTNIRVPSAQPASTSLVRWIVTNGGPECFNGTGIALVGVEPTNTTPRSGQGSLSNIDPPAPGNRIIITGDPGALPNGARAHFPAYEGDPFIVTLPVAQRTDMSANEVLNEVLLPTLRAMRFERGFGALSIPPAQGIKQPVGDFSGLAKTVAFEYANTPQLLRPKTQDMLDVFLGKRPADQQINDALQMGEGMDFAQFVGGIERLAIDYPFQQVDGRVPIEHTNLVASRWEGQGVTTVWGNFFNKYTITNRRVLPPITVVTVKEGTVPIVSTKRSTLVLLPYGTDSAGIAQLRYAHRIILRGKMFNREVEFLLWIDAEDGKILKLESLNKDAVPAAGLVYNRDPGVGTITSFFQVDPAVSGQYTLKLSGVMNRIDFRGDGEDVSISDSTNGSSATFANFNQAPINDVAQALCASGTNKAFQQVNFFSTLLRNYQTALSQGIYTPFPTTAWNPKIESPDIGCNADFTMEFGACKGYYDPACPNFYSGAPALSFDSLDDNLNFAHDNTIIGHELGHNITQRLTNTRPEDLCGSPDCSIPYGWGRLHDLADFWADHFESTNCYAGWAAKNAGGVDNSLYCTNSTEAGIHPRLHQVTVPFNPGVPGDHFPEHRVIARDERADMQIASAALWEVRVGMRSKCRPSGLPQFGIRFQRALKATGSFGYSLTTNDIDIYRLLYDLEAKMVDQWATSGSPAGPPAFAHNGPHTTNKVTGGFARAGLFLIPYQCLDGNPGTSDATVCSAGENGGDAVIDIDDNDPTDDLSINGALHPEVDFLKLGGPAPTFHVWTGPRYKLDGARGASTLNSPAPCNTKFRVEVSTDPAFPAGSTINSPWIDVDTNPTTADSPECYGTWMPSAAEWTTLQAGGANSRIHYRARTRNAADGNERLSTMPGGGLWTVPPPYAVITASGRSDY